MLQKKKLLLSFMCALSERYNTHPVLYILISLCAGTPVVLEPKRFWR